jgi:hypothetical protein
LLESYRVLLELTGNLLPSWIKKEEVLLISMKLSASGDQSDPIRYFLVREAATTLRHTGELFILT